MSDEGGTGTRDTGSTASSGTHAMTVMLVEDNEAVRAGLTRFFRRRAATVYGYDNAAGAVDALRNLCPDALVADWDLREGGSGIDVARVARRLCPHIRIIMVTGRQLADLRASSRDVNIDVYVAKPFSLATLARALGEPGGSEYSTGTRPHEPAVS